MKNIVLLKSIILLTVCLAFIGCASRYEKLKTVEAVDLDRYMGDWYVIAHIPTFIETKAFNGVESYKKLPNGQIDTVFTFNQGSLDGPVKRYNPRGFVIDKVNNSTWAMQFVWPFKAEFLITYVDPQYQQTIVSRNKRDYVWIMARKPHLSDQEYEYLLNILKDQGYDINRLRKVPQKQIN